MNAGTPLAPDDQVSSLPPSPRARSIHRRVLNELGSIRVGVALFILIFIYSSIGSAFPPIRQGALADWFGLEFLRFEKTEMEWFNWWPFQLMIAALCLAMVAATLRIKLQLINAGVWAIHCGIVILAISSAVYFACKIEGEAVIFHSRALVLTPGMSEPASMVVRPDARMVVGSADNRYDIRVADLNPDYVIREGAAHGKKTTAIWLSISQLNSGSRFARRLLLGYPELTEDYLIESGGIVRVADRLSGRTLLDENLQIHLWYDPAEYFFLHDTTAVYARFSPDEEWKELRVEGMPHYFEYVDDPDSVATAGGDKLVARPLSLPAKPRDGAGLDDIELRITGFLPYADTRAEWRGGGDQFNPMLRYRIRAPFATTTDYLLANIPRSDQTRLPTGQSIRFKWASAAELEALIRKPVPRLVARLTGANGTDERTIPLAELEGKKSVLLEGTDYALTLERKMPAGTAGMNTPAGLFVQVSKAGGQFYRVVFEGRGDGSLDLDQNMNLATQPADAGISFEYLDPAEDRLVVIAFDESGELEVVRTTADGQFEHRKVRVGEAIVMAPNLEFVPEQIVRNARQEFTPYIVPRNQRQPGSLVRQTVSQARVEVRQGEWSQQVWLRHHDYAFPDVQRAQPGRFAYAPTQITLPDGRQLELLLSRWRERLPAPVALDRFVLQTYPGGDQPSDYISRIRFDENGTWSPVTEVRSNRPARHGDYWYFQSQYDPQTQSHTVLGVGNRVAVGWMLAGTCLSIAGMLYAFYVKPVLIRRRKQRGAAAAARAAERSLLPDESRPAAQTDVILK